LRRCGAFTSWSGFGLSDPALQEALYDVPLYRDLAGLDDDVPMRVAQAHGATDKTDRLSHARNVYITH
jgi:IS5 family transposase